MYEDIYTADNIVFSDIMTMRDSLTLLAQYACINNNPPFSNDYDYSHQIFLLDRFSLRGCHATHSAGKGNFRRYIGKEMLHCKLKITSEKTLNYIKTYNWTEDQKFEKQEDGSTIMTFTSNQDYPILGWVLSHGMYVQPLEPEWLVNEWEKNVKQMARLAERV